MTRYIIRILNVLKYKKFGVRLENIKSSIFGKIHSVDDACDFTKDLQCLMDNDIISFRRNLYFFGPDEAIDPGYKFLSKLPKMTDAHTTKDVTLKCVINDHKAAVTWYKDSNEIKPSEKHMFGGDMFGRHLLKITGLIEDDSGDYTCKIIHGESTVTKLVVTAPVYKFISNLQEEIDVYARKDVTMRCLVNDSNAVVTWYKNGSKIEPSEKYTIESDRLGRQTLEIKCVTVDDVGEYICEINHEEKTVCKLVVIEPDPAYKFRSHLPETTDAYVTEDVTLKCFLNDHKAVATWFKNGSKIEPSEKYRFEGDIFGRNALKIKGLTLEDNGHYSCKITDGESTVTKLVVTVFQSTGCSFWTDDQKYSRKRKAEGELHEYIKRRNLSCMDKEEFYPVYAIKGKCIIFNNNKFCENLKLSDCIGSEIDTKNLKNSFEAKGFEVEIHLNLSATEIRNTIRRYAVMDLSEYGSFVCIFSSHGSVGYLYGKDEKYLIKGMVAYFSSCTTLINKPKIFIVDSCQGKMDDFVVKRKLKFHGQIAVSEESGDEDEEEEYSITPLACDFAIYLSTVFGFYSYTIGKSGSNFLNSICKALDENNVIEIDDLKLKVNNELSQQFVMNKYREMVAQTPLYMTTLRKRFII